MERSNTAERGRVFKNYVQVKTNVLNSKNFEIVKLKVKLRLKLDNMNFVHHSVFTS